MTTEPPQDRTAPMRILHLSDTHARANGGEDAAELGALDDLLAGLSTVAPLHLVMVTGDVSEDDTIDGGTYVRRRVGRFAADRGIPHIYLPGNHDDPPRFSQVFGHGHIQADSTTLGVPGPRPRSGVSMVRGLRVITLDSSVPGAAHGELGPAQLAWLRALLDRREAAPSGTIVALHHPPLHSRHHPIRDVMLDDSAELADGIEGSDVRAILCGHLHHAMAGRLGDVPVYVAPSVVSHLDLRAPPDTLRMMHATGASIVELDPTDRSTTATTVLLPRPGDGALVGEIPAAALRR